MPRIQCPHHQIKQVIVPWARPESGFTLMFEAFVMALAREMPVAVIAGLVAEHDTALAQRAALRVPGTRRAGLEHRDSSGH